MLYNYQARSRTGQKVEGVLPAKDPDELAGTLREMDLFLVDAAPEAPARAARPRIARGVKRRELINFTLHLATAVSAGIPILQAFEDLGEQTADRRMKEIIAAVEEDLRGGRGLSEALERHPRAFSAVYCSMVHAGEVSGSLVRVLQHLVDFLEWQDALAGEVKRATIYPATVFAAVVVLLGVLLGFVFPRILPVIENLKIPLPFLTRAVMAVADGVRHGWYVLLAVVAGLWVLARLLRSSPDGAFLLDALKLRLPVVGGLVEKICLSRFAHHFGILMQTGVEISQSLTIAERVVGNAVVAQAIREAKEKIIQGGSLWRSLQETGVFPPLVVRMVSVGETTGTMDSALGKVADYYDREIPATVKRVFAVLEPLVIILLAVIVLLVALSIFLPLYGALGRIGRR
jgi:type IV pilus assembly protein PilC